MFDLTGGAFDISIGTGLPSLELDADDFLVRATTDGVQVDLGGIGKGYAVDLMAELLEEWGLERALVHGGFSSVLALEPPAGRDGWPLTLSDPGAPSRVLARLSMRQTALSASGVRKGDHIVDPRTGEPARGRLAAWVALPRPESAGVRGARRGGAEAARRRRGRRVDDRLHAARAPTRSRPCASAVPGWRPGSCRSRPEGSRARRSCSTSAVVSAGSACQSSCSSVRLAMSSRGYTSD